MTNKEFYPFPPSSKEEWTQKAEKDLKEKDFQQTLVKRLWSQIQVEPFYTQSDLATPGVSCSFHPDSNLPGMSPRIWANLISVFPGDTVKNNQIILDALQHGADGLILHLNGEEDLNQLMKAVHTEFIETNFLPAGEPEQVFRQIQDWLESLHLKPSMLTGSMIWSPCDELFRSGENFELAINKAAKLVDDFKDFRGFRPMTINLARYANAGATGIQELVYGLGEVVELIDHLAKKAVSPRQVFEKIALHTAIGDPHFAEIAKVKALRKLLVGLAVNYGVHIDPEDIHIITSTSTWSKSLLDKNTNLIRQTYEAMAGILGGGNSLWVKPAAGKDASVLENRVARNVSSILKEESYLDKVMDPAAGSFYLEKLQEEIVNLVIKGLQELEENGGWLTNFEDRSLQAAVRNSRESAQKKILSDDTIKVGVNKYLAKDSLENHLEFDPIVEKDFELLPSRATYFVEQKTLSNA
ncbi:methylmalonyl-CoA mutase family protein [Algoriphagus halophytocola]|uniref:Methylmalonyl-CoA mutase family protein n=1 Tax=Algoriphagus halophytocola TaxID=2991499 RepID=A0ABY6ML61_9BACT|nr:MULTISPECIES: methylmalonyl-CoA mutase family protein [unclassified Algoriphagus]UZD24495.1 methylmalonyl-CoA mutase family protein [Algoriphagus sp. TR-M5]WBL41859.1 methylmalonyl-CoA mutase family protein [Algoriphagus sp. TR-M9]